MNSYLCTITFLALMGMLTSSEVTQHYVASFEKKCYTQSRTLLAATEEASVITRIDELLRTKPPKKDKPKKKENKNLELKQSAPKHAKALGINMVRPPNNSRLNFFNLLHKDPHTNEPKTFSLYQVLAQLMRNLYSDEPFFKAVSDAEKHILDKIIEKKELTTHFDTPDQLSEIDLENELLQKIFYHMLKGTQTAPSLLNYITFDKTDSPKAQNRKINLLFADPRVIHAIFPEGNTAHQLIERRDQFLETIEYQELNKSEFTTQTAKGRRDLAKELKNILKEVLTSAGFDAKNYASYVFDYGLGKPGTILFIENSQTYALSREKYIPTHKLKN